MIWYREEGTAKVSFKIAVLLSDEELLCSVDDLQPVIDNVDETICNCGIDIIEETSYVEDDELIIEKMLEVECSNTHCEAFEFEPPSDDIILKKNEVDIRLLLEKKLNRSYRMSWREEEYNLSH